MRETGKECDFDEAVCPGVSKTGLVLGTGGALEYIDEFVSQSDTCPLTEPIPLADWYGGPLY